MEQPRSGSVERIDRVRPEDLERLRWLSRLLDTAFRLPGGYRIGLDGLLGLIPGAGDTLGALLSTYIIAEAARLGAPTGVLFRMIGNVALDTIVGLIPIVGDLFDFAWKANARNVALLEQHLGQSSRGEAGNRRLLWVVVLLAALVILLIVLAFWGLIEILRTIFG